MSLIYIGYGILNSGTRAIPPQREMIAVGDLDKVEAAITVWLNEHYPNQWHLANDFSDKNTEGLIKQYVARNVRDLIDRYNNTIFAFIETQDIIPV